MRDLDKSATIFNVHTVQEEIDRTLLKECLAGTVTVMFGGLALLLAAIGLYGVMAYGVAGRTREFGIRIALGARAGSIIAMVLREASWLLAAGTALGIAAMLVLGRMIRSLLFGIEPADPVTGGLAVAVLVLAALLAASLPARRAARADPTQSLRFE